jgi:hypothetical protein
LAAAAAAASACAQAAGKKKRDKTLAQMMDRTKTPWMMFRKTGLLHPC